MRRTLKIIAIFAITFLFSSCVKESRDECPCYLFFGHKGFVTNGYSEDMTLHVFNGSRLCLDQTESVPDLVNDDCEVGVERGNLDVSGLGGIDAMELRDRQLLIHEGNQCDPVYSFTDQVETYRERALVYGEITKQYALITLDIIIPSSVSNPEYRITGNSVGFDIFSMDPVEGDFSCIAALTDGRYSFRVPRQSDDALKLEIWSSESNVGTKKVGSVFLGYYIKKLGYDWTAPSLTDIDLRIDLVSSTITISIRDWNIVEMYTIDI